jgi:hypothetical protein
MDRALRELKDGDDLAHPHHLQAPRVVVLQGMCAFHASEATTQLRCLDQHGASHRKIGDTPSLPGACKRAFPVALGIMLRTGILRPRRFHPGTTTFPPGTARIEARSWQRMTSA